MTPSLFPSSRSAKCLFTSTVVGLYCLTGVANAACPVHPNAQANDPVCTNGYAKLQPSNTVAEWHGDCYYPIGDVEENGKGVFNLDGWIAGCAPRMPVYLPFRDPEVRVTTAFVYPPNIGDEATHNGIDYARGDGDTFAVRCVADGRVLFVGYHPSPGNVVIIEHYPREGPPFRSIYHHLRNGRDNDIDLAARTYAFVEASEGAWSYDDAATAWQEAGERARAITESGEGDLEWVESLFGSNDQALLVQEGDTVAAGQQIAWAGDTGMHSGGTHLHFMTARQAAIVEAGVTYSSTSKPPIRWTFFDPYGVYGGYEDVGCYNNDDGYRNAGQHDAIFAPALSDFIELNSEQYDAAFSHYATFNYFPAALDIESVGKPISAADAPHHQLKIGEWVHSGSFQYRPERPVVRTGRTFDQHQADVAEWSDRDWYPREVVGVSSGQHEARYAAIYAPVTGPWESRHKMSPQMFEHRFSELYGQRYTLTSLSAYSEDGSVWLAATWAKTEAFEAYVAQYNQSRIQLEEKDRELRAKGLHLTRVFKYRPPGQGTRYGAIWHQQPPMEETQYYLDLSADAFRTLADAMAERGWTLYHIDNFEGKYSVVFARVSGSNTMPALGERGMLLSERQLQERVGVEGRIPVVGEAQPTTVSATPAKAKLAVPPTDTQQARDPEEVAEPDAQPQSEAPSEAAPSTASTQEVSATIRKPTLDAAPELTLDIQPQPQTLLIEGESMVYDVTVNEGTVSVQNMLEFGRGWSGNGQMLWAAESTDGRMSLSFHVPKAGKYRITAALTTAPKYGRVQLYQHGVRFGRAVNTYSASVNKVDVLLGTAQLEAGSNWFVVAVDGRDHESGGYHIGIDAFTLVYIGP